MIKFGANIVDGKLAIDKRLISVKGSLFILGDLRFQKLILRIESGGRMNTIKKQNKVESE